jgi:hypothetical protein
MAASHPNAATFGDASDAVMPTSPLLYQRVDGRTHRICQLPDVQETSWE